MNEDFVRGPWITVPEVARDRLVAERNNFFRQKKIYQVLSWTFGVALSIAVPLVTGMLYHCKQKEILVATLSDDLRETRKDYKRSRLTLFALARSHKNVLDAKDQINTVGEKSWGRKFVVTKYYPPAGGINSDKDPKHTATMTKADPKSRIVAVDPSLVPYGSWVWIEDEGWYRAEDCGGLIKGFRIDILAAKLKEAKEFGRQERFVLIVPKGSQNEEYQECKSTISLDDTPRRGCHLPGQKEGGPSKVSEGRASASPLALVHGIGSRLRSLFGGGDRRVGG